MLLGAASGIGSAICARFASEGANLILVDRNQQKLRQTYKEITCNYGKDHLFDCGDVSSPDFVQKLFTCIKVSITFSKVMYLHALYCTKALITPRIP